jgi:hypothetical protein
MKVSSRLEALAPLRPMQSCVYADMLKSLYILNHIPS